MFALKLTYIILQPATAAFYSVSSCVLPRNASLCLTQNLNYFNSQRRRCLAVIERLSVVDVRAETLVMGGNVAGLIRISQHSKLRTFEMK